VFFVAPGQWDMWKCQGCGSAYLDPRPNERTIGLAYENYYTHARAVSPTAETSLQRFRNLFGNDYRNATYKTRYSPSLPGGRFVTMLARAIKRRIDTEFRFLPSRAGIPKRVLDIGCGNGSFLNFARDAGWQAVGVEPDPAAREVAHAAGFDVRPALSDWPDDESFGYVTLCHVIEHVHDPRLYVQDAFDRLAPGGRIYIETPNIDARGHEVYGPAWRGLEPPRHLVLFNRSSLLRLIDEAGFRHPCFIARPEVADALAGESRKIAAITNGPYAHAVSRRTSNARFTNGDCADDEFLTVMAEKPR